MEMIENKLSEKSNYKLRWGHYDHNRHCSQVVMPSTKHNGVNLEGDDWGHYDSSTHYNLGVLPSDFCYLLNSLIQYFSIFLLFAISRPCIFEAFEKHTKKKKEKKEKIEQRRNKNTRNKKK